MFVDCSFSITLQIRGSSIGPSLVLVSGKVVTSVCAGVFSVSGDTVPVSVRADVSLESVETDEAETDFAAAAADVVEADAVFSDKTAEVVCAVTSASAAVVIVVVVEVVSDEEAFFEPLSFSSLQPVSNRAENIIADNNLFIVYSFNTFCQVIIT